MNKHYFKHFKEANTLNYPEKSKINSYAWKLVIYQSLLAKMKFSSLWAAYQKMETID